MIPVKVYRITCEELPIPECGVVEFGYCNYDSQPLVTRFSDDYAEYKTETSIARVQEIYEPDLPDKFKLDSPNHMRNGITKKTYIAIDEDLERFLTVKYQAIIDSKQYDIENLLKMNEELSDEISDAERVEREFWALPWYKRLISVLTRKNQPR